MTNRDFQVTSRSFRIPITEAEYDCITHCERRDSVAQMLEELPGVYNVDYNGHFGLYIFLSVEKPNDNDKTLIAISNIIDREGSLPKYEIWSSDGTWTMTTIDKVESMRATGFIEEDAQLIHEFYAATYEAASAIYDETIEDLEEI